MPAEGQQQRPTVFISYAHESDTLRASVKALADWLGDRGCPVLTDHPYVHRPPERGWPVWMHDCVRKADTVLVVCTPKLKGRYEKNEEPGTGFGATFEGAIVTQHIYDAAMRNTKFFPIIPDAGSYDDVPTTLRPWWNRHSFLSGNEGILRMIFEGPADDMTDPETRDDEGSQSDETELDQARRQENERRLEKLRKKICRKIKSSKAAMVILETEMDMLVSTAGDAAASRDDERAGRLVDGLMYEKGFLAGKTALLQAYNKLTDQDRHDAANVIRRVSRLLIPWLYVTGFPACRQLNDDWWQKGLPGDVLVLPASLRTFAEIVMAGLDRREVKHRNDDELWPTGAFAVRLEQPESGIADATEDNLRTDLFRTLKAPLDHAKSDPSTQDRAIIGQLKYWSGKGFTPYLICDQFSKDEQERQGHKERLKRISGKYPGLAIVELGGLMDINDQDVFNEIRDLLLPYES